MADFGLLAKNFPLWRSIRAEHLLDPTTNRWELEFHTEYMQATGLTPEQVQRVLETFLVPVDDVTPDAIEIHLATTDRPSTYILGMYNRSRKGQEPRNLTPEEIAGILNAVPFVMSCDGAYTADHTVAWNVTPEDIIPDLKTINPDIPGTSKTTADSIRFSILKRLTAQLLDAIVTPLGLEDLKDQILYQFEKSRIHPGSMVGVTAAEALGGPITQMALNSFHSSGSAKNVSVGIDAIRELLNVSQKRKHERCTIYFKRQDLSFDDILVKRNEIVEVTVSSLIADYDINSPLDLGIEWWHYTYETAIGRTVRSTIHKDIHQISTVLRLYLNIDALYENRITMDQIVSAIDARNSGTVMCLASPLAIGIIDIYPNEEKIREPLQADKRQLTTTMHIPMFSLDFAPFTFLNTIVYPSMHKIWIKGINGITRLFPSDSSIWRVVRDTIPLKKEVIESEEDPVAREQLRRIYYVVMNRSLMKASGITVDKLKQLITAADCVVTEEDPDYLVIMLPDPAVIAIADAQRWTTYPPSVRLCLEVKEPPLIETDPVKREKEQLKREKDRLKKEKELRTPSGWIFSRIALDDKERKCLEKYEKDQGNPFYMREVSPIERASKLYYAETEGSNLQALLSRDDIDDTRTLCNNVHEIYRVLGIEAARTFLIREFLAVLGGDGGDINPRHVTLLVDFMTNMGEPTPITFSGISRQPIGALEKASFERAMDTFQEAAGFGKSETIKSVSAAVVIGQRAKIGTGYMDIIHDGELEERFLKEIRELVPPPAPIIEEEREILDVEPNFATGTVQKEDDPDVLGEIVLGTGELTPQFEPDVNIVKEAIPAPVPKGPEVVTTLNPAVVALVQRVGGIPAFKHPVGEGPAIKPAVPTPPRVLGPVPTLPLPTLKAPVPVPEIRVPLVKPMAKPSPIRVSITPVVAKPVAKPSPTPIPTAIPTLKAPAPPEIKIPLNPVAKPVPTLKARPEIQIPLKPSPPPLVPIKPAPVTTPKLPPITLGAMPTAMPKVALPPLKPVAK